MSDLEPGWWNDTIFAAGGDASGKAQFLSSSDGSLVHEFTPGIQCYDAIMLSPSVLGLSQHSQGVRAYDLESCQLSPYFTKPNGASNSYSISSLALSNSQTVVASGFDSGHIGAWSFDSETSSSELLHQSQTGTGVMDMLYLDVPSSDPCLTTMSKDQHVRFFDVERYAVVRDLASTCCNGSSDFHMASSTMLSSVFVPSAGNAKVFQQIDLRAMEYAVRDSGYVCSNQIEGMAVIDDHWKLVIGTCSTYDVFMFDLRGSIQEPLFRLSGAHGSCLRCRPIPIGENSFATGSLDKTVKTWGCEDGSAGWQHQAPTQINALVNVGINAQRFLSGVIPIPTTDMGSFLCSDQSHANMSFLSDNAVLLHDASIVLSGANGELATFHTYQSLISASKLTETEPTEFGRVVRIDVPMTCDSVSLEEDKFMMVLLGSLPVESLLENPKELLDFCEIVSGLRMKKMLWYVAEKVKEAMKELSLQQAFDVFKEAYERFEEEEEEEEEGEDDDEVRPVIFQNVIVTAAFEGLREKNSERVGRGARRWLGSRDLYDYFLSSLESPILRSHRQLEMPETVKCLPPNELLAEAFTLFAETTTNPNVELVSQMMHSTAVFGHVESMILAFDFFKLMLRFEGREREVFERRRQIELKDVTPLGIELLVKFAYVGSFPDEMFPLLDVLLILRLAEQYSDERLTEYCVARLQAFDTSQPEFLESILRVGNAFEDVQARMMILEAWVSQGNFTMSKLQKQIARAAEAARASSDMDEVIRRVDALERANRRLQEENQELRSTVETQQAQIAEILRRLDSM